MIMIKHLLPDAVANLRGAPPPYGPKFSQFHAVFGNVLQNRMLAPPPTGNPGSAPGMGRTRDEVYKSFFFVFVVVSY